MAKRNQTNAREDEVKDTKETKTTKGNKNKGGNKSKGGSQKYISAAALQTNENIRKNAASIPFFKAIGRPVGFSKLNPASQFVEYAEKVIPGILVMKYVHGPGVSVSHTDPVNLAADASYSFNRHMNAGAANYDSNDQMLYQIAACELYMFWSYGVRALGLINVYDQTNGYLPKALVTACGFNFDDLLKNQTKMRGAINTCAALMSSYAVPDIFPYYQREITMTSRVYTDRDVLKPQIYVLRPEIYRTYEEATSDKGAVLKAHVLPDIISVDTWIETMNTMINKFRRSEDCGIISGDLLKAYGKENVIRMPVIDESYVVFPTYDEDWLSQIHNAKILTDVLYGENIEQFDIKSDVDSGLVKYLPIIYSNKCVQLPNFIDIRKDDPTPEDVLVATRLHPSTQYGIALIPGINQRAWAVKYAGLEIVTTAYTVKLNAETGEFEADSTESSWIDADNAANDLFVEAELSKFNWAPFVYTGHATNVVGSNPKWTVEEQFGEVSNYALLSDSNLEEIHRAEILAAFNIPYDTSY